ncbi:hypothetical protein N8I77_006983 [Diaporthe amygdali]|uniref:FAD-binding PCMH-type domain-containing protein n=1 Tax=Phomopsis amygdali TaxID=1214568 RepID=A0AAD9SB47_PHOAM|nr:hypothetical protein N8I77_006983 [Diaporthe amygdali]
MSLHYEESDNNFTIWDQKQLETVYACRVEPASADEVSKALQVLVNSWCKFAVKCGGHSRYPDDSVSIGGVTIDLGLMNATIVSDERTTARVGGGALSRQVFAALDPYGLAYIGGRVGQVGMGGFTIGGGTSVLAAKYGWALDNVLEYEVVLANSTIVTASENSHADLYYALRGGGNNFGIVTSFNVNVFPQGPVYTGSRSFADNQTNRFFEEAEKTFTLEDSVDTNVGFEYRYTYSDQEGWTMSSIQRYAEPVMNPAVFDALNSVPALGNLTGAIKHSSEQHKLRNIKLNDVNDNDRRNVFASLTHYPSIVLSKEGIAILKEMTEKGNLTGLNPQLISYSIPTATMEMSRTRGGNALGLDVEGHLIKKFDVFHPYIYINYGNKGQDVFGGYGEKYRQRLIEVSKAVDPSGVFTSSGLWTGFFKVR